MFIKIKAPTFCNPKQGKLIRKMAGWMGEWMDDSIRRQDVIVLLWALFKSHDVICFPLRQAGIKTCFVVVSCYSIRAFSGGTNLTVALRGTTRGLWLQSQSQPGANPSLWCCHTLSTSQTSTSTEHQDLTAHILEDPTASEQTVSWLDLKSVSNDKNSSDVTMEIKKTLNGYKFRENLSHSFLNSCVGRFPTYNENHRQLLAGTTQGNAAAAPAGGFTI